MNNLRSFTFMLLGAIVLLSCVNESQKSSNVDAETLESKASNSGQPDEQIAVAKKLISSIDSKKVESVDAKKMFKNFCAICHGRKGNMTINGAKDLSKSTSTLEQRVAQVYFGKGTMTPFKGMIKDEEIIAVAKYIDELRK